MYVTVLSIWKERTRALMCVDNVYLCLAVSICVFVGALCAHIANEMPFDSTYSFWSLFGSCLANEYPFAAAIYIHCLCYV